MKKPIVTALGKRLGGKYQTIKGPRVKNTIKRSV